MPKQEENQRLAYVSTHQGEPVSQTLRERIRFLLEEKRASPNQHREEYLKHLKTLLETGKYKIDGRKIALKIVQDAIRILLSNKVPSGSSEGDNMSEQVNLWPFLSKDARTELSQLANSIGTDTIYVQHKRYYERRNLLILKRYYQLKEGTKMTNHQIYEQIAREITQILGTVTAKAVQHVIYASDDSRNF